MENVFAKWVSLARWNVTLKWLLLMIIAQFYHITGYIW